MSAALSSSRVAVPAAVAPRCPHFGVCGGCQTQHIAYAEQLRMKRTQLLQLLSGSGVEGVPEIAAHSAAPYEYRNRIRLRIEPSGGEFRMGYNVGGTTQFTPITVCPIAAPLLPAAAQAFLRIASAKPSTVKLLEAAHELELFANQDLTRLQLTLFCEPRLRMEPSLAETVLSDLQQLFPQTAGLGIEAFDPRSGPTGRTLAAAGAPGLSYVVGEESYWVTRGAFFQVNRFLLDTLVEIVCGGRSGDAAWDLFAGVGLFSRLLAASFSHVTAVEASPVAAGDLAAAFRRFGRQHRAIAKTTLDFLREASTQRERPELIVLDPPRAGAGMEACALVAKLAPRDIIYVSCDPATLARDLRELQSGGYHIRELHLVDLFPQTTHMETVAVLSR